MLKKIGLIGLEILNIVFWTLLAIELMLAQASLVATLFGEKAEGELLTLAVFVLAVVSFLACRLAQELISNRLRAARTGPSPAYEQFAEFIPGRNAGLREGLKR